MNISSTRMLLRGPAQAMGVALTALLVACAPPAPSEAPAIQPAAAPSAPTRSPSVSAGNHFISTLPCDPDFGVPRPRRGCPDRHPLIGLVTHYSPRQVTIEPLRIYLNNPEGRAYAREHQLEFPFSNDYYQAVSGPPQTHALGQGVICSGIIQVGRYAEPLKDRAVGCGAFARALGQGRSAIPAAAWFRNGVVFQLSELYRP